MIDETHSATRGSWVASANGHSDFPIQNLPLGVFAPAGGAACGGVAIGDEIFDLAAALEVGLFDGLAGQAAEAASGATLNPLFALGGEARRALRRRVSDILDTDGRKRARIEGLRARLLHRAADCRLELPAAIGDYTDFFAGIHHATNAGKLFRPDNPLLPNYKYVPIGYHGRASSIRPSGAKVRRPNGQRKGATEAAPSFGPSRSLDFELELEVSLLTPGLAAKQLPPQRLSLGNARHLYWTVAQLIAHHSSGGCNLRAGDLFGTGTISAPTDEGLGSLLEISAGGGGPPAAPPGRA